MKYLLLLFAGCLSSMKVFPQKRNNTWCFGDHAVFNFNTSPLTVFNNSAITQLEGCASISNNNTGQLLFYSDGVTVWNRNHQVMLNGTGLFGNESSTQSALIVPLPGSNMLYYIFAAPVNSIHPLSYSIVDMTLDGGLGAITSTKNFALYNTASEKLTGTLKGNGTDYWIISKENSTDGFFAYSLTAAGVDPNPVISHTGITPPYVESIGYSRVSPDGLKICLAYDYSGLSQLMDFNRNTGVVSNAIDLVSPVAFPTPSPYGVEFSPDNSKLYITEYYEAVIWQYDLLAGSPTAIQNSAVMIAHTGSFDVGGGIQSGPDNKIYVNNLHRYFVSVINQPNLTGAACAYVYNAIPLGPGSRCGFAFPNDINLPYVASCPSGLNATSNAILCANQTYQLPSGIVVSTPGIYSDTIRNQAGTCDSIITNINLSVLTAGVVDTAVQLCSSQTYTLPSGAVINAAGIYPDTLRNVAGCDSIITTVTLSLFPVSYVNTNLRICSGQSYTLPSGIVVNTNGIYVDTLRSVAGCDSVITTSNLSVLAVSLVNETALLCSNQTYTLPSGTIVSIGGIYIDTLRSVAGCDSIITHLSISVLPVEHVNTDLHICSNETYHLPSGATVSSTGIYVDTLRSAASCDSIINSIHVFVNDVSAVNMVDSINSGQTYLLASGETVSAAGVYQSVFLNSAGCDSVITTTLKLKQGVADCIILKNAFTPNGDGINDYWVLFTYRCFKRLEVNVYNRYGTLVYHADDYKNDWDGKYKNKELPDGTYYYVIKVISFDGRENIFKGNVTIIR